MPLVAQKDGDYGLYGCAKIEGFVSGSFASDAEEYARDYRDGVGLAVARCLLQ